MYQNQCNSTGYGAETPSANYNQEYYNYYYQQYPSQAVGYYNQTQTPQAEVQPSQSASTTDTQEEDSKQPPPPPPVSIESNTEKVDMEMENDAEKVPPASLNSQEQPPQQKMPSAENQPAESTPQVKADYSYTQTPPVTQAANTGSVATWTVEQPATPSPQWYSPQGGVASWGGANSGWSANNGGYSAGNWQNSWPEGSNQQQQQQQQQQWWGQWAGQEGAASGGQWGQWQGQPGMEAWAGQQYAAYQQQQQQQPYGYPQSYANTPQQQQQQPANYQGTIPNLLTPRPDLRRSRSPGTPPLPDPTPPGGQDSTPQYQGVPIGGKAEGVPPSQGKAEVGGSVVGSKKHRRTEEHDGGDSNNKRCHTDGGDSGRGQPHSTPVAEGAGSSDARRKSYRGRESRWGDRGKADRGATSYNSVPPPILPLPTPNIPPRDYSQGNTPNRPDHHHQSYSQQLGNHPLQVGHTLPPSSGGSNHSSTHPANLIPNNTHQQNDLENPSLASLDAASKDKMPPKLKSYVARAFSSAKSEEERELVHHHLDSTLNKIFAEKRQWDLDWDAYPLPLDAMKKKTTSRWDTPSPSFDQNPQLSPQHSSPTLQRGPGRGRELQGKNNSEEDEGWAGGYGRGRGRGRKKKNKKQGGKNKFYIDNQPSAPLSQEDKARISNRIDRFGKQGKSEGNASTRKKLSMDELVKSVTSCNVGEQIYWQDSSVEGTSQALEKRYLRLTSAPDPSMVRPQRVLKLSLKNVCDKWQANSDYHYTCEQFKAIRQDLTIQGVRNEFTVEVYEIHARIALENNDREGFNQCQTQLMALYGEERIGRCHNQPEFIAYRFLYLILTSNTADMSTVLLELSPELKQAPCIVHAHRLCSAWLSGNYAQFFRLYRTAPHLCGALINMFIDRERKNALRTMAKAYRPSLPVTYLSSVLAFTKEGECLAFLVSVEAVLASGDTAVDCKLTQAKLGPAASSAV